MAYGCASLISGPRAFEYVIGDEPKVRAALASVAVAARCDEVSRLSRPALGDWNDVIDVQLSVWGFRAAVLAGKFVAFLDFKTQTCRNGLAHAAHLALNSAFSDSSRASRSSGDSIRGTMSMPHWKLTHCCQAHE